MQQVIFGLGSNVGDRGERLAYAARMLAAELEEVRCSAIYESKAVLPEGAPKEWDKPYWNMALAGKTNDGPVQLLVIAKHIEQQLGREDRGHWAPREIDVDILALGDTVLQSRTLILPHKQLLKRDFALLPLAELAPGWRWPLGGPHQGVPARELVKSLGMKEHAGLKRVDVKLEI